MESSLAGGFPERPLSCMDSLRISYNTLSFIYDLKFMSGIVKPLKIEMGFSSMMGAVFKTNKAGMPWFS